MVRPGMRVIGNWGAMFPYSYGEVVSVENGMARIKWEDMDMVSLEPVGVFKTGSIRQIGLYIQE